MLMFREGIDFIALSYYLRRGNEKDPAIGQQGLLIYSGV